MKKWVVIILKTIAFVAAIYGIMLGIFYLAIRMQSERELWRITEYSVSDPVVINDLLIFHGYRVDRSVDCYCLYAINKSTGEIIWTTEELAQPYIDEVARLGLGLSTSFSVGTGLELVSPTGDFIYVNLDYWATDYTSEQVLLALRSSDGKMLWKVNGAIDTDSFSDSVNQMNRFFVVDNQGDMLAVDSTTGEELWRHKVYPDYDQDYSWFTYHNNIVLLSTFSSECLKCCCQFRSDEQPYEQITAFSAETGNALWETVRLDSGSIYVFNDMLYMVSRPWKNSSNVDKMDDNVVTAIDLATGEKRWDFIFPDAHEFSVKANSQHETFFFIKTYEGGSNDFHKSAKLLVVDEFTGKSIWQFNQNFSYGNLSYLLNENIVYIGTEDGSIYSLDGETGNIIWQTKTEDFSDGFVVEGNDLIVIHEESYVSVLNAETGLQKWKSDLGIDGSWSIFGDDVLKTDHDSTIYVAGNSNSKVYAIDIDTGKELWSWSHFRPTHREYEFMLIDNGVAYVSEQTRWTFFLPEYFVRDGYFFALKTEP